MTDDDLYSLGLVPRRVYPWPDLDMPGANVLIPTANQKEAARVRSAAANYQRRHEIKLVCRQEDGGVRVWRTE